MQNVKFNIIKDDHIEDIRVKSFNAIKEDEYCLNFIKENNLSNDEILDNASKFLKCINSRKNCINCSSSKNCKSEIKGCIYNLIYDGDINVELSPCDKTINKYLFDKKYIYRDFDDDCLNYSVNDLQNNEDYRQVRRPLLQTFGKIIKGIENNGIYLYGSHLIGKTFMMGVFSKVYCSYNNKFCAFINTPRKIKELNDLFFTSKDTFNQKLNELINIDLLVLDDFGNEYKNEIIRDNIVYPILSSRLKDNKLTCFTSSYSLQELKTMYNLKEGSSPRSKELINIIEVMTKVIELKSLPFRK